MLKIKDSVDLKELEKFGFKEDEEPYKIQELLKEFNFMRENIGLFKAKSFRKN